MGKMGKWIVETLMYQWFVYFPLCVDVGENGRENGKIGRNDRRCWVVISLYFPVFLHVFPSIIF